MQYAVLISCEEESFTPADVVGHRVVLVAKIGRMPFVTTSQLADAGYIEIIGLDVKGDISDRPIKLDFNSWIRRTPKGTARMLATREYLMRLAAFVQNDVSIVCNPPYYEPDLGPHEWQT